MLKIMNTTPPTKATFPKLCHSLGYNPQNHNQGEDKRQELPTPLF